MPAGPDSPDYEFARKRSVEDALADDALISELRAGGSLPERYGAGLDERIVEYPWLLAHQRGGPTLDAGSVLNHDFVLQRVLPHLAPLFTVTLRPEAHVFTDRGVSYIYADLRDLPLREARFQTVICASTLEHVGMDNSPYGEVAAPAQDPEREVARAVSELVRVTASGGTILVTVPYGRREDHGWFRQLDRAGVGWLVEHLGDESRCSIDVYAYGDAGWQRSDLNAAGDARYGERAPGARAIACVRMG